MGLLLAVVVTAASVADAVGHGPSPGHLTKRPFPRLEVVRADSAYGKYGLPGWVRRFKHFVLELVRRPAKAVGWLLLPKRWVVERTFAWLGRYRIHSRDYERLPENSETQLRIVPRFICCYGGPQGYGASIPIVSRKPPKKLAWCIWNRPRSPVSRALRAKSQTLQARAIQAVVASEFGQRTSTAYDLAGRTLFSRSQARLGNAGREALLPVWYKTRSRASQPGVPKQSLGTRTLPPP